jgi:hypothetical protein
MKKIQFNGGLIVAKRVYMMLEWLKGLFWESVREKWGLKRGLWQWTSERAQPQYRFPRKNSKLYFWRLRLSINAPWFLSFTIIWIWINFKEFQRISIIVYYNIRRQTQDLIIF